MSQNASQPANTPDESSAPAAPVKGSLRFVNTLALIIIILSGAIVLLLIYLAWRHIGGGKDDESFKNTKDVISILLPLVGTWMGTILAFYFSKENFEAANQRVKELVNQITSIDEKLQVLKASDVMKKPSDFNLLMVKDEAGFKAKKLNELIKIMDDSHTERLPILESGTLKFIFLIYRTTIERFMLGYNNGTIKLSGGIQSPPASQDVLTVDDMFQSDYKMIKDIIEMNEKKCFMSVNTTLDKVKEAMQDNTICQDVFITQTGNKDEAVAGWITNDTIIEKAELFKKAGAKV